MKPDAEPPEEKRATCFRTARLCQRVEEDDIAPWVEGGYEKYFLPNDRELVVAREPYRMNQRLSARAGTFVMPGVLHQPVEALANPSAVVKFVLETAHTKKRAMISLYHMNMSNATLFPGLDGLARFVAYELVFHRAFDPVTMEGRKGFYVE